MAVDGHCRFPRPASCQEACDEDGACALVNGDCVIRSSADCRGSLACREDGRCFYNRSEQECDDGQRRRNRGAMAGGIAMMALGGIAIQFGLVALLSCEGARGSFAASPFCSELGGAAALVAGGAMTLGGIPLVVWGAGKEPRRKHAVLPDVTLGPSSATLRWRW